MIRVSKCVGNTAVVVQSTILLQLLVARMMWTYKVDANLVLGENSKEPSTSTILAEASFDDDVNKKALNRNKFLLIIIEKKIGHKLHSNITCANPTKYATENIGECIHYWEMYSMQNTTHFKNRRIRITR